MSNPIRERAKEQFPTVLMTLLSIMQALSLELWWQFLSEQTPPVPTTVQKWTLWLQVVATLAGIATIWVVYASTFMRFRWVPSKSA